MKRVLPVTSLQIQAEWINQCTPDEFIKKVPTAKKLEAPQALLLARQLEFLIRKDLNNAVFVESALKEINRVLRPHWSDPQSLFGVEAALLTIRILGDTYRFGPVRDLLKETQALWSSRTTAQRDVLQWVTSWVADNGSPALRDWLLERLVALRPNDLTQADEIDFNRWIQSLRLAPPPRDKVSREFLSRKLRELSIAFPTDAQRNQIRALVKDLEFGKFFSEPRLQDLNVREILTMARAQLRFLQTERALESMKRIRSLPRKEVTEAELWEAFQFHIRLLRLSDQRHLIPGIMQSYLNRGKYLEQPAKRESVDWPQLFSRWLEIARHYWNYDDPKKAIQLLDRIILQNEAARTEHSLGAALVVRARIAEQQENLDLALRSFDRALAMNLSDDQRGDLTWRKIFLRLDHGVQTGQFAAFLQELESLQLSNAADNFDRSRWFYWYGQALLLNGRRDEAFEALREAYRIEDFSFYSNMAGLELIRFGKKPQDWVVPVSTDDRESKGTPDFDDFVTRGKNRDTNFDSVTRFWTFLWLNEKTWAERSSSELDRSVWTVLLSSKYSWSKKREFYEAVVWLRDQSEDAQGRLRATEVLRQAKMNDQRKLEASDLFHLYPRPYWNWIESESRLRKKDPWLVTSLIRQESAFSTRAKSVANAMGLMQMIPPVAIEEARLMKMDRFEPEDLYNPQIGIRMGTHHLGRLVESLDGSWIAAIGAYNAGTPPVLKWLNFYLNPFPISYVERIPFSETRNYVRSIMRNYVNYQRIYGSGSVDTNQLFQMPQRIPGTLIGRKP